LLISTKLSGIAKKVVFGDLNALETALWESSLDHLKIEDYQDKKVVIKGCERFASFSGGHTPTFQVNSCLWYKV